MRLVGVTFSAAKGGQHGAAFVSASRDLCLFEEAPPAAAPAPLPPVPLLHPGLRAPQHRLDHVLVPTPDRRHDRREDLRRGRGGVEAVHCSATSSTVVGLVSI